MNSIFLFHEIKYVFREIFWRKIRRKESRLLHEEEEKPAKAVTSFVERKSILDYAMLKQMKKKNRKYLYLYIIESY